MAVKKFETKIGEYGYLVILNSNARTSGKIHREIDSTTNSVVTDLENKYKYYSFLIDDSLRRPYLRCIFFSNKCPNELQFIRFADHDESECSCAEYDICSTNGDVIGKFVWMKTDHMENGFIKQFVDEYLDKEEKDKTFKTYNCLMDDSFDAWYYRFILLGIDNFNFE